MSPTVVAPSSVRPIAQGRRAPDRVVSLARTEFNEPASPTGGDVQARSASHGVRRLLSSSRLVLDVIASTGRRDMAPSELARRMQPRGYGPLNTNDIVAVLLQRGLLVSDGTTLLVTDIGWQVTTRRTPPNRASARPA